MTTSLFADAAALMFVTPKRAAASSPPESIGRPVSMLLTPVGKVAMWSEGVGPTVLMVHGWSGSHKDMSAFIDPLITAGYNVVSFDLPAHGLSEGLTASIPEMADAIRAVATAVSPIHGVIAHSVGCAATGLALARGMQSPRTVLVGPPARYADFARAFSKQVGVDPEALLAELRRRDIDVDNIDLPAMAPDIRSRALVIHSADDQIVPFTNGQAIAAAWPDAYLMECDGLGHRKILADSNVVAAAVSFLAT